MNLDLGQNALQFVFNVSGYDFHKADLTWTESWGKQLAVSS